jgi:hypothetical protein
MKRALFTLKEGIPKCAKLLDDYNANKKEEDIEELYFLLHAMKNSILYFVPSTSPVITTFDLLRENKEDMDIVKKVILNLYIIVFEFEKYLDSH